MEYAFTLTYKLGPANVLDADALMQRLGEAGCTDAMVGLGVAGQVGLDFIREAANAQDALLSALADVRQALPDAAFIEASPDFVGLSDVALLLGLSRQNIRKLWLNHADAFPPPVHSGTSSVWHLAQVLQFLIDKHYTVARPVHEVAGVAMRVNIARQKSMVPDAELQALQQHLAI